MSLEDRFAQHDKIPGDKFINTIVDYIMRTWDYVVRPSADAQSGPITVTLPPVAEAKGRWYSIIARNADAVNTITVADRNDSECWIGDIVLDGKCDRVLVYSDGLAWHPNWSAGSWPGAITTTPPGTLAPTTLAPTTAAPIQ
uniref:Uncharacterized protein n=1 Tax=viral metagenome TaxID=1070528 RepID=A0A6H1ZX73_9ZZZZ